MTGVNLIGYAKGELGIGEDVRMSALALLKANINFNIIDFPKGIQSRQNDLLFEKHIKETFDYGINIVNLTGFEHVRLLTEMGQGVFDGRYTIGVWPWELKKWPERASYAFKLVDEIWASSEYTKKSYEIYDVPVLRMPMAVDVSRSQGMERKDFGIAEGEYILLYVFDGLSYMARKNPIAHIKAFQKAFSNKEKVRLIIKTMNNSQENHVWLELMNYVKKDKRIKLINEVFSREALLDLIRASDAFVSLHRAEGFGRCIAEAMLLGKPVIVSKYSGNLEFTKDDNSFLVSGKEVKVGSGEYLFSDNQSWFEADIECAAMQMRKVFSNQEVSKGVAKEGQNYIAKYFSEDYVGKKMAKRIKKIVKESIRV